MNYIDEFIKEYFILKSDSESDEEYKNRIKDAFEDFRFIHVAADYIQEKGIASFMLKYSSRGEMPDEILKKAFSKCTDAIKEFEKLLPEVPEWPEWEKYRGMDKQSDN